MASIKSLRQSHKYIISYNLTGSNRYLLSFYSLLLAQWVTGRYRYTWMWNERKKREIIRGSVNWVFEAVLELQGDTFTWRSSQKVIALELRKLEDQN